MKFHWQFKRTGKDMTYRTKANGFTSDVYHLRNAWLWSLARDPETLQQGTSPDPATAMRIVEDLARRWIEGTITVAGQDPQRTQTPPAPRWTDPRCTCDDTCDDPCPAHTTCRCGAPARFWDDVCATCAEER